MIGFTNRCVAALLVAFFTAFSAFAQDAPESALTATGDRDASGPTEMVRMAHKLLTAYNLPGLDTACNFESVPGMDIVQVLTAMISFGNLKNVVIGKTVSGQAAKVSFSDVPLGEALEIVLSMNQLAYDVQKNVITIMSDQEYRRLHGDSFYDHRNVKIVKLKYADPTRVATMLTSVKSDIGSVVADPVTGNMILVDTPNKLREMDAVIAKAGA